MKCDDIIKILCRLAPEEYACSWDNVGLLSGRRDKEVQRVLVTLDLTDAVLENAINENVDMIVSHHPMLFRAIKKVNDDDFITRRLIKLISNDISYYAMHTNFDMAENGMAKIVAECLDLNKMFYLEPAMEINEAIRKKNKVLNKANELMSKENKALDDNEYLDIQNELKNQDNFNMTDRVGTGIIGELSEYIALEKLCQRIKLVFDIECLSVYGNTKKQVKKIAICPGAGEDYIDIALKKGADVYITGDIKHHVGLDASEQGLTIIDATHFGLEKIFVKSIKDYLQKNINHVEIIAADMKSPITYF